MRKFAVLIAALAALTLAGTAAASTAGNWQDSRLDAAASSIAGHPVNVWCEMSWGDWIHAGDYAGQDFGVVLGFTYLDSPTIYISPAQCDTLHALLNNEFVGSYHASLALLTLAHESVHQRGIADESVTECTALPLVPGLAEDYFGFPATIQQTKIVSYTKTVVRRIKGQRVVIKIRAQKAVKVTVPDPWLKWIADDAQRWHNSLPAQYRVGC